MKITSLALTCRTQSLSPIPSATVNTPAPDTSGRFVRFLQSISFPGLGQPRRSGVPPASAASWQSENLRKPEQEEPFTAFMARLGTAANKFAEVRYCSDLAVAPSENNPGCIEKTIVKVNLKRAGKITEHYIDANTIDIADNDDGAPPTRYLAGRSPVSGDASIAGNTRENPGVGKNRVHAEHTLEFDKTLVQAIESGQGLYQFVWEKTHRHDAQKSGAPRAQTRAEEDRREKSVYEKLTAGLAAAKRKNKRLALDENYFLDSVNDIPGKELPSAGDYFHYQLAVTHRDTGKKITIPMTQVGLPLVEGRLATGQIVRAHAILESHRSLVARDKTAIKPETEPLILSNKGRIRNATLIAYTSVYKRIYNLSLKSPSDVDDALHDAIAAGYAARGAKKFIPSSKQIAILHATLHKQFAERSTGAPLTSEDINIMKAAAHPSGARVEKAMPFNQNAFLLRNNIGGGDCLFHALGGSRTAPNLPRGARALRNEVADYVQRLPDTPARARNNWHSMSNTLLAIGDDAHKKFMQLFKDREEKVTNVDFAAFIRQPSHTAGNDEIQLWLDLERNRGKTVVVIDGEFGDEKITWFAHRAKPHVIKMKNIAGGANVVAWLIGDAIGPALAQEHDPACKEPQHLALYRSNTHFQRIVNQRRYRSQENQAS